MVRTADAGKGDDLGCRPGSRRDAPSHGAVFLKPTMTAIFVIVEDVFVQHPRRCRSPSTIPFCHGLRNAVLRAGMEDKEEDIGNLKGHRRHSEGIHSGESVTVISEEGRGGPQIGFTLVMRRTRSRISASSVGRSQYIHRDFHGQYLRNPCPS